MPTAADVMLQVVPINLSECVADRGVRSSISRSGERFVMAALSVLHSRSGNLKSMSFGVLNARACEELSF